MLKRIFFILMSFSFIAACSKEEPPPPVTPQTTTPPATTPAPEASQPSTSGSATAPAPTTPPPQSTAPTPPASSGGASTASASGEQIYKQTCSVCHVAGVAGAPKLDDKANWAPRLAQGKETLYTHAIKGFQGKVGVMPPKGGNMSLTDEQVKAAVDYMAAQAGK